MRYISQAEWGFAGWLSTTLGQNVDLVPTFKRINDMSLYFNYLNCFIFTIKVYLDPIIVIRTLIWAKKILAIVSGSVENCLNEIKTRIGLKLFGPNGPYVLKIIIVVGMMLIIFIIYKM